MSEPTERDRRVAVELLGWDAEDSRPFSDDPEAAADLVERLGRLGVQVEVRLPVRAWRSTGGCGA